MGLRKASSPLSCDYLHRTRHLTLRSLSRGGPDLIELFGKKPSIRLVKHLCMHRTTLQNCLVVRFVQIAEFVIKLFLQRLRTSTLSQVRVNKLINRSPYSTHIKPNSPSNRVDVSFMFCCVFHSLPMAYCPLQVKNRERSFFIERTEVLELKIPVKNCIPMQSSHSFNGGA